MIKLPDEKQKMIDWLKHQIGEFENISDDLPFGLEEDEEMHLKVMRFALDCLNATAQPVSDGCNVPEGWKLVPLIAFPSQWAAGQKAFDSAGINKVDAVYKAMVAAAPGGQDD